MAESHDRLTLIADVTAQSLSTRGVSGTAPQRALDNTLPAGAAANGRTILVTDRTDRVVAAAPAESVHNGHKLTDVLADAQQLVLFAERAGVVAVTTPGGDEVFATVRALTDGSGQVAVLQSQDAALAAWDDLFAFSLMIFSATGMVLGLVGAAFYWQAARAREADRIYEKSHASLDAAPEPGPVRALGLGLVARHDLLVRPPCLKFSGIRQWMPCRRSQRWTNSCTLTISASTMSRKCCCRRKPAHRPCLPHASGRRGRLGYGCGARAARSSAKQVRPGPAWSGSRSILPSRSSLPSAREAADLRLSDAIEAISEAFVLWDRDNRLVLCNSKYQQFHNLPEEAVVPGTHYADVIEAARHPVVRTELNTDKASNVGARTFEAQLDDGRWLHVDERRTKDGGYVSVGTDITSLKDHEEKMMESERELMATIADLRRSRQALEQQAQQLVDLAEKYSLEKERAEAANRLQVRISRQYQPRAAHTAQCHHRVFGDHGERDVRQARLG